MANFAHFSLCFIIKFSPEVSEISDDPSSETGKPKNNPETSEPSEVLENIQIRFMLRENIFEEFLFVFWLKDQISYIQPL